MIFPFGTKSEAHLKVIRSKLRSYTEAQFEGQLLGTLGHRLMVAHIQLLGMIPWKKRLKSRELFLLFNCQKKVSNEDTNIAQEAYFFLKQIIQSIDPLINTDKLVSRSDNYTKIRKT